jgi:hypothetical protein
MLNAQELGDMESRMSQWIGERKLNNRKMILSFLSELGKLEWWRLDLEGSVLGCMCNGWAEGGSVSKGVERLVNDGSRPPLTT